MRARMIHANDVTGSPWRLAGPPPPLPESPVRAEELPVLVAHSRHEVHTRLVQLLAPRRVEVAADPFALMAEVEHGSFAMIVLEHPLLGFTAPALSMALRERNVGCPLVVLAEGSTSDERQEIAHALGRGAWVLDSVEPLVASITRTQGLSSPACAALAGPDELEAPASATVPPGPVPELRPDVAETDSRLAGARLALKVDHAACERWVTLGLPPRLIAELDGARSIAELEADTGMSHEELMGTLRQLDALGCLDLDGAPDPGTAPDAPSPDRNPRVAWTPPEPARSPDESGGLRERPAAHLLLHLKRDAFTGIVMIETPGFTMRLDVAVGTPLQAGGGPPGTGLGDALRRLGMIDEEGLRQVLCERDFSSRPLGDAAIRLGLVTPTQLLVALRDQVESAIRWLVGCVDGTFRLYRDRSPLGLASVAEISLERAVEEALRRDDASRSRLVRSFLADHGERPVRPTPCALELLPAFHFGGRVQRLLRQLDGRPLRDVLLGVALAPEEATLALYLLWAAGGLELGDPPRSAFAD